MPIENVKQFIELARNTPQGRFAVVDERSWPALRTEQAQILSALRRAELFFTLDAAAGQLVLRARGR